MNGQKTLTIELITTSQAGFHWVPRETSTRLYQEPSKGAAQLLWKGKKSIHDVYLRFLFVSLFHLDSRGRTWSESLTLPMIHTEGIIQNRPAVKAPLPHVMEKDTSEPQTAAGGCCLSAMRKQSQPCRENPDSPFGREGTWKNQGIYSQK